MIEQAHSYWGMSSAHRYMACPGSVSAAAHHKSSDSKDASLGTLAHEVAAATLLRPGVSVPQVIAEQFQDRNIEPDVILAVREYVRFVRQLVAADPNAQLHVEVRFQLPTPEVPESDGHVFGTCDACVYHPSTKTLHIIDYKNGVGVVVDVEGNAQLLGYGAGALFALGLPVANIELHIVQPRSKDGGKSVKSWRRTAIDVFDFRGELADAIRRTLEPQPEFVPGDHCHFCPLDGQCPARTSAVAAVLPHSVELDEVIHDHGPLFPAPEVLTDEQLASIVNAGPAIRQFLKAAEERLKQRLMQGQAQGLGQKLVKSVARREWKADVTLKDLVGYFKDAGVPVEEWIKTEMWSPAEVDKLLKLHVDDDERRLSLKRAIEVALVDKESKGLTLAPADDRRPAVDLSAQTQGLAALAPPPTEGKQA